MSSPPPRTRRGAHRTGRSVVGALVPSALAVVAVAALITSLAVWRGQPPVQPRAAAATTSTTPVGSHAPGGTPSSTAPARSTPSTPAAAPTTSAPVAEAAVGSVEVVVLNQTSRAGLAGDVADVLRGKGWSVPAVGNFRGVVPTTTVYYPDGAEVAARAAAESLPTAARIRPRFGNLSTTRLTVVVTTSYPG